jgi:hypothetical protein
MPLSYLQKMHLTCSWCAKCYHLSILTEYSLRALNFTKETSRRTFDKFFNLAEKAANFKVYKDAETLEGMRSVLSDGGVANGSIPASEQDSYMSPERKGKEVAGHAVKMYGGVGV